MNAPCSGAPLTAPHVTTGGLCRWKAINKVGRHVGLDFYDLLIEGHFTQNPSNLQRCSLYGRHPSYRDSVGTSSWESFPTCTGYLRVCEQFSTPFHRSWRFLRER